jgi:hypothetical protein
MVAQLSQLRAPLAVPGPFLTGLLLPNPDTSGA